MRFVNIKASSAQSIVTVLRAQLVLVENHIRTNKRAMAAYYDGCNKNNIEDITFICDKENKHNFLMLNRYKSRMRRHKAKKAKLVSLIFEIKKAI